MRAAILVTMLAALPGCGLFDFDNPENADGIFAALQPPSPGEAARWAIDPDDPDRRYRGTILLANAPFGGDDLYLQLYRDAVNDTAPNVRAAGVRGLANHGSNNDVPLIIERLTDEDRNVRLEAARGLQRIHNPEAVAGLLRAIDPDEGDNDAEVRAAAADALGQYAERRVVLPLIGALADQNLVVNRNARRSLTTLTGEDFELDRRAWADWYADAETPFAGRTAYVYPVFTRDKRFWEHIPLVPSPPVEPEASPAGFPPEVPQPAPDRG